MEMTPQLRWYYKNREKVLARAKQRREEDPAHHAAIQRKAYQRKRAKLLTQKGKPCPTCGAEPPTQVEGVEVGYFGRVLNVVELPPEGYDPLIDGPLDEWKRRKGLV